MPVNGGVRLWYNRYMKLPPHAKRVFKGIIFDVYQWEQELFDGSMATFEAIKRVGTVQVIPTIGDKALLAYEEQPAKSPSFSFFGGRMEEDEEPLDAAKRELLEETGLTSDEWELYKEYGSEGKIIWPMYLFIARNCRQTAEPHLDPGEKIERKEFEFAEFMDMVTREDFLGQPIKDELYRLRQTPEKLGEFKNKLFPK